MLNNYYFSTKVLIALIFYLLMFSHTSFAEIKKYQVNYNKSYVEFSGQHMGNDFSGKFNNFNADINKDGRFGPSP